MTVVPLMVSQMILLEKSSGERVHPCGRPVLMVHVWDVMRFSLTCCCPSIRKIVIH